MSLNANTVKAWLSSNPEEAGAILKEIEKHRFDSASIPQDTGIVDRILMLALNLVKADRCALYFIEGKELYSTSYDIVHRESGAETQEDVGAEWVSSSLHALDTNRLARSHFRLPLSFTPFVGMVGSRKVHHEAAVSGPLSELVDGDTGFTTKTLIALPLFSQASPNMLGIAVFMNKKHHGSIIPFTHHDEILLNELLQLVGISVYSSVLYESLLQKEKDASELAQRNAILYEKADKEARKNRMMLDLASSLFSEDNVRELGKKIISYARELINADRASVFLLNEDTKELVSAVFDTDTNQQFTISSSSGIAGFVATTGNVVNLENAYDDPRFNPEMDKKTGYRTQSILCVPIPGPNRIVGVTNLINKLSPKGLLASFTKDDEEMFQTFSVLCGLALHKTLLLQEIRNKQMQLEINMDIMSYHAMAQASDLHAFMEGWPKQTYSIEDMRKISFDAHVFSNVDDQLVLTAYNMFEDLGYLQDYKISKDMCLQYILTIRKNYRQVAYHNFTHAVSVTHSIYLLTTQTPVGKIWSPMECFAMFLAALSHDIDHRGTNNAFQKSAHTALANYYSTSTMERHHFNHAVMILRSPGHNMFHAMSNDDYKKCLKALEGAILATDLALYFANKGKLKANIDNKTLDFKNPEHLDLVRGIIMTCCDLTAMTKPWTSSRRTADSVYEEFFYQGDQEKALGLPFSANLMDRENAKEIPAMQHGFFNAIVVPAFELMSQAIPETMPWFEAVKENHLKWKELMDSKVPYEIGK